MWGRILSEHAGARLVAACDHAGEARANFAAANPAIRVFATLDDALTAGGFDAVLLATPPGGHLTEARAIFARRLPLLAEKPLAAELGEARAIVELAEKSATPLSVGLNFRYLPVSTAIRDLVARGEFGEPGFGQFTYQRNRDGKRPGLNKYPLTMRHPMMLEQSIHHLDLIRFCYGREAIRIACRTWNPPWSMYAHDANVSALITLEGGLEVNYLGTWTGGWDQLRFEWRTDCAGGVIVQRELFADLATARTRDEALTQVVLPACTPFVDDSAALLGDFVRAIRDRTKPPCGGRDHLRSLALCFAGIESAETGRAVDMAEFEERHGINA
jgi:predicted dehydrogenase